MLLYLTGYVFSMAPVERLIYPADGLVIVGADVKAHGVSQQRAKLVRKKIAADYLVLSNHWCCAGYPKRQSNKGIWGGTPLGG